MKGGILCADCGQETKGDSLCPECEEKIGQVKVAWEPPAQPEKPDTK